MLLAGRVILRDAQTQTYMGNTRVGYTREASSSSSKNKNKKKVHFKPAIPVVAKGNLSTNTNISSSNTNRSLWDAVVIVTAAAFPSQTPMPMPRPPDCRGLGGGGAGSRKYLTGPLASFLVQRLGGGQNGLVNRLIGGNEQQLGLVIVLVVCELVLLVYINLTLCPIKAFP